MGKVKCCVVGCETNLQPQHRFPNPKKDMRRFQLWLEAINNESLDGADPQYIYDNKKVCHCHFESKHFSVGARRVHSNAVPTLNLPVSHQHVTKGVSPVNQGEIDRNTTRTTLSPATSSNLPSDNCLKGYTEMDNVAYLTDNQENLTQEESTVKVEPILSKGFFSVNQEEIDRNTIRTTLSPAAFSNLPSDNCLKDGDTEMDNVTYFTDNQESLTEEESTVEIEPILSKEPSPPTTSRKRVYGFPRFIQALRTAHFSTPDKTRIVLRFIRDADKKKSKKIKDLQTIVLRLNKRIRLLEDALLYLHDKGLISEENLKEATT